ncbi:ubiquitin-related modifier 1 [Pseudochaenichthys georgianus]|nr:ubiquitin-related modifier 1 [Pseudochaenichthys georgianus]
MAAPVVIHLEFGGGAELLFNGVKDHHVTLPSQPDPCEYHLSVSE